MKRRYIKVSPEEEIEICDMYKSGISLPRTGMAFNRTTNVIRDVLKRNHVKTRHKSRVSFSKDDVKSISERYAAGEPSTTISKSYNVLPSTIRNLLRRHGFHIRPVQISSRRSPLNRSFFDHIDTEEKAYWLGFIAADGGIMKRCLVISLKAEDIDHLQKLSTAIGSTLSPKIDSQGYARIAFSSSEIVSSLSRYHVTPRKTFTVRFPELPTELDRHYLRGYFDGDGGIYLYPVQKTGGYAARFQITSNRWIIQDIREKLTGVCNHPGRITVESPDIHTL